MSSLYREGGKTAESPVYEDIGPRPQAVNKIQFEFSQNDAYGHQS